MLNRIPSEPGGLEPFRLERTGLSGNYNRKKTSTGIMAAGQESRNDRGGGVWGTNSAPSNGSQTRELDELRIRGNLERQKLRDITFARDQNDHLLVSNETSRPVLWCIKHGKRAFFCLVCIEQVNGAIGGGHAFRTNVTVANVVKLLRELWFSVFGDARNTKTHPRQ